MKNNCKRILITGVSGGMGASTAHLLIDKGFQVFGLDIRSPEMDIPGLIFTETDLRDAESIQAAFLKISEMTDHLDAVINMAGIYDLNSLIEISEEEFINIFNINLFSIYRVNRTFFPLLRSGSRIIITSSELAPLDPLPFTGLYAVTKSAVEKYAYSLRMELALLGIDVIVLRPGAVDTRFIDVSTSRLDRFCSETSLYSFNSVKFREITDKVEARKIAPTKIGAVTLRAVCDRRPKYIYKINRNPLLLIFNALPARLQTGLITGLIRK